MPFCDISTGATLYFDEAGQGVPLLLVHGLLGSGERHFKQVIEWLKADYRCIAPTLRGYGLSTPKPRVFPLDFYHRDAEDILAFMDARDISQAHLLGYSDGGETALVAAGLQPQRFKSVAVIGAVGNFTPAVRARVQSLFPATWITEDEKQFHGIVNPDAFILPWIKSLKHIIDSGGDVSLSLADRITCPLLVMLGETDTLNPAEYALKYLEHTPNGRLEMFRCGHAVHDEAWDQFRQVYNQFLAQSTVRAE
ncbi:MAG: alpha/beta hydrolase [Anaerolineae bacterium]